MKLLYFDNDGLSIGIDDGVGGEKIIRTRTGEPRGVTYVNRRPQHMNLCLTFILNI